MERQHKYHRSQNREGRAEAASYTRRSVGDVQARAYQTVVQQHDAPELGAPGRGRAWWVASKSANVLGRFANQRRLRTVSLIAVAGLIVAADFLPIFNSQAQQARYDLATVKQLVDPTESHLQQKLKYDTKQQAFSFNPDAASQLPGSNGDATRVGGVTYSAQLPANLTSMSKVSLTDATSNLTIDMVPQFGVHEGRQDGGYLVYPLQRDDGQLIYTFKQNGVKEDIVLYRSPGKTASYSYKLSLPVGLEARMMDDGSVGVYGGDKTLYGNISYGSDADKALVEKARNNSRKNTLMYVIPAPVITGNNTGQASAKFTLDKDLLTVTATSLDTAHYPLSIDPSFIMDTNLPCSWRNGGNDEGNIDYTGCQLKRSSISGGTVGSWTISTSAATGHLVQGQLAGFVAYNSYLYAVAGDVNSRAVYYAPINASTGAVEQFVATSSMIEDRREAGIVITNGYIYAVGGTGTKSTVEFAKIDPSNGSVGTWSYTSSLNVGRMPGSVVTYGGRIYTLTGCSAQALVCTGGTTVTEHATIRGDGSLSSWSQSTSAATGHTPTALIMTTGVVYNSYLYLVGGQAVGGGSQNTIYYAPIKSDGTVGAWASADVTLPVNLRGPASVISNGYLYVMGGNTGGDSTTTRNTVYLAKVYGNGKLGPLQQTTSFTTARTNMRATVYNGRIYLSGGQNDYSAAPAFYLQTQYATISTTPGAISPFATESDLIIASPDGMRNAASVVYGGYIYLVGGVTATGNNRSAKTYFAKINTDGSTGAWATAANDFTDGRANAAAVAYNGYLYVMGGQTGATITTNCPQQGTQGVCRDIQKAPINSTTGNLGAWSSAGGNYNGAAAGRQALGAAVYNGYMYVIGGDDTAGNTSAQVDIGQINTSNGNIVSWTNNTTSLAGNARTNFGLAQSGKYVYLVGGLLSGNNLTNTTLFATLSDSGGISVFGSAGNNFATARVPKTTVYNGYLYLAGGRTSTGSGAVGSSDVQYIKLNSDGTLNGSWTTSSVSFTNSRFDHTVAMHNGFMYVMGGCRNTDILGGCSNSTDLLRDVQYTQIYNGGGGDSGTWTSTTNMPAQLAGHGSVALNGYLYVIGGCSDVLVCTGGNRRAGVYHVPINTDGSLGTTWTTNTSLPVGRAAFGITTYNGAIYALGGVLSSGSNADNGGVYTKPDPATGNITSWSATSAFTVGRQYFSAVAYNGYIYIGGGTQVGTNTLCHTVSSNKCSDVQYAPINPDGSLGVWHFTNNSADNGTTFAGGFTTSRANQNMLVTNGYLYVLGGAPDAGGISLNDVQYAQINSNGTVGTWNTTSYFSVGRHAALAYATNGYMYIYAGSPSSGGGGLSTVEYAPIMANGTLGNWHVSGATSSAFAPYASGAVANGHLYILGGYGIPALNTAYYAPLQSTPQIARHSMLLTTDATTKPANFFTTVASQSASSSINVGFAGAVNTASPAFGSTASNIGIISASKYTLTTANDGVQYYWLTITLDDSQSFTWGETAGSGSSMSYLQLNYHPNTAKRLRGGKTFNNEQKQSLDAY